MELVLPLNRVWLSPLMLSIMRSVVNLCRMELQSNLKNTNRGVLYPKKWYAGQTRTRNFTKHGTHGIRMVRPSKRNGPKTTQVLSIFCRIGENTHPFVRITLVHCDSSTTREHDLVAPESMYCVLATTMFDPAYNLRGAWGLEPREYLHGRAWQPGMFVCLCVKWQECVGCVYCTQSISFDFKSPTLFKCVCSLE